MRDGNAITCVLIRRPRAGAWSRLWSYIKNWVAFCRHLVLAVGKRGPTRSSNAKSQRNASMRIHNPLCGTSAITPVWIHTVGRKALYQKRVVPCTPPDCGNDQSKCLDPERSTPIQTLLSNSMLRTNLEISKQRFQTMVQAKALASPQH